MASKRASLVSGNTINKGIKSVKRIVQYGSYPVDRSHMWILPQSMSPPSRVLPCRAMLQILHCWLSMKSG